MHLLTRLLGRGEAEAAAELEAAKIEEAVDRQARAVRELKFAVHAAHRRHNLTSPVAP